MSTVKNFCQQHFFSSQLRKLIDKISWHVFFSQWTPKDLKNKIKRCQGWTWAGAGGGGGFAARSWQGKRLFWSQHGSTKPVLNMSTISRTHKTLCLRDSRATATTNRMVKLVNEKQNSCCLLYNSFQAETSYIKFNEAPWLNAVRTWDRATAEEPLKGRLLSLVISRVSFQSYTSEGLKWLDHSTTISKVKSSNLAWQF